MKPQECQIGMAVIVNQDDAFFQWTRLSPRYYSHFAARPQGIISNIYEEIKYEKGRKQYTVEFGKRKAIYPQIKIVSRYATVILTDGVTIDVNIEDLTAKSCGGP